jgi:hypothetical protein
LSITGTGKLDITNNGLVIASGSLPTVASYVTGGQLISSKANADASGKAGVGFAQASQIGIADGGSFMGKPADASSIVARYTLKGDATLDGIVDSNDFSAIANNFNGSANSWAQGDFNNDGVANALDFNLLATNYGSPLPGGDVSAPSLGALVPEPGSATLLMLGAGMLASRRRRNA